MPDDSELQIIKAEFLPLTSESVISGIDSHVLVRLWFSRPVSEAERLELEKRYNFGVSANDPKQATITGATVEEVSRLIANVTAMLAAVAAAE